MLNALFEGILGLPPALVLALVLLLPALEASAFLGVIVPGEVGVILGGVLANQGKLPLAAVLAAGISGAIAGDSIGFWVGGRYGERLLARLPRRLVKPEHIQRTAQTVERLGGKAVFVGWFTAALRALVPGIAGMSRMTYRTFLPWNVAGGVVWATGFRPAGLPRRQPVPAPRARREPGWPRPAGCRGPAPRRPPPPRPPW